MELASIIAIFKISYKCVDKINNKINSLFSEDIPTFLEQISESEFNSAILSLKESEYSTDPRREITIAVDHLRLSVEKTEQPIKQIEIYGIMALCYMFLKEEQLKIIYKDKAIATFADLMQKEFDNLRSSKHYADMGDNALLRGVAYGCNFAKKLDTPLANKIPALSKMSYKVKLTQVGLDIDHLKKACSYDWLPNPYGDQIHSTSMGDKDERLIAEAIKQFKLIINEYLEPV